MGSGHFFLKADWFLQYVSNPVQASWSELLCGVSGKTLVVLRRSWFRVSKDYRTPFEFTLYLSCYTLKGLFQRCFHTEPLKQ